ncbi:MAG: hypothetical protein KJO08_09910 [Gammaproteobacteria bacterium]|nr:hypothetical protein [Gammaproteobacteria bacterium]NNJ85370.1 hypothetical protein [Gammaproteobacteria bacterium]
MSATRHKLLFVYNAGSGIFNTATDIAHKLLSPNTYQCQLCALSHGYFTVRKEWKSFLEGLSIDCEFLHTDQFRDRYPDQSIALPAVLRNTATGISVCLAASTINQCKSLEELKLLITEHCVANL